MAVLGSQKTPGTLHRDNMPAQTPGSRPVMNTGHAHSHQQPGSLGILISSEPQAQHAQSPESM